APRAEKTSTERRGPVVIDARMLRIEHPKWESTLLKQGRSAALSRIDPDVHREAAKRMKKALEAGRDVRLVLPSNDPEAIVARIKQAREAGYTVTLAVRVTPDVARTLDTVAALDRHVRNRTAGQAVWPAEQNAELRRMQAVLEKA